MKISAFLTKLNIQDERFSTLDESTTHFNCKTFENKTKFFGGKNSLGVNICAFKKCDREKFGKKLSLLAGNFFLVNAWLRF